MAGVPDIRPSKLGDALRACRGAFIGVGLMSFMINLLYLTGSIFMLEIYDRVLPSRSVPTLVGLIILAASLYAAQGVLDLIRGARQRGAIVVVASHPRTYRWPTLRVICGSICRAA